MSKERLPAKDILCELIEYDGNTGELTWRRRGPHHFTATERFSRESLANIWNGSNAGCKAFETIQSNGYRSGRLFNKSYLAHRVIWKIVHGTEPETVDHIDGDKSNNRIGNLRAATASEQAKNQSMPKSNTSGFMGVSKHGERWKAQIRSDGLSIYLGLFDSPEDAGEACMIARRHLGFHENHGRTKSESLNER